MAKVAHDTISTTELVRNLAGIIDNVRLTGSTLYVTKGTLTVAKLSPPPKSGLSISKLISLIESLPRLGADAPAMANDIKSIRNKAILPENPWA